MSWDYDESPWELVVKDLSLLLHQNINFNQTSFIFYILFPVMS